MPLLRGSVSEVALNASEPPGWYLERVSVVYPQSSSQRCNARNTDDLEAITGDIVDKVCTLDLDVLYG